MFRKNVKRIVLSNKNSTAQLFFWVDYVFRNKFRSFPIIMMNFFARIGNGNHNHLKCEFVNIVIGVIYVFGMAQWLG